jgi:hypothetical protein
MFGAALRLLAVGEASRRLGDYAKNLATKYLMLSAAGTAFLAAIVFVILAVFWALISRNHDPVLSAWIMAGILALVGFLIVFIAYGITREKPLSARQALRDPIQTAQNQLPTADDIGRQIEHAVRVYGPVRVATAAAAGGLVAGLLAKRFGRV